MSILRIMRLIEEAVLEDVGTGDVTTDAIVTRDATGRANIFVKESGTIAGLEVAGRVFQFVDQTLTVKSLVADGACVQPGAVIVSVDGSLASILRAERTALNILQRMSGIATLTGKFVAAIAGTRAMITDTRKTAPGLRILDKLAVKIGGGVNHRFGLDDMVLIKNNHVAAAGSISVAIERCLQYLAEKKLTPNVEVETRSLQEVRDALGCKGIHRIMLDNFAVGDLKEAVRLINHAVEVEASGNVSLANVRVIAEAGVDFISVGALTHSAHALDIALKVTPAGSTRSS